MISAEPVAPPRIALARRLRAYLVQARSLLRSPRQEIHSYQPNGTKYARLLANDTIAAYQKQLEAKVGNQEPVKKSVDALTATNQQLTQLMGTYQMQLALAKKPKQ